MASKESAPLSLDALTRNSSEKSAKTPKSTIAQMPIRAPESASALGVQAVDLKQADVLEGDRVALATEARAREPVPDAQARAAAAGAGVAAEGRAGEGGGGADRGAVVDDEAVLGLAGLLEELDHVLCGQPRGGE